MTSTFTIGGDLTVNRLGFGAMRLTGKGVWGPPADRDECIRVLRRAVELGVNFIDTADSYGPYMSERTDPRGAAPVRRSRRRDQGGPAAHRPGRVARARLPRLPAPGVRDEPAPARRGHHRPVPAAPHRHKFPAEDQVGELVALQQEGKIRHIGLSEVNVEQLERRAEDRHRSCRCRTCTTSRRAAPSRCSTPARPTGIAFIPWFPLAAGPLAAADGPLQRIAADHDATPSQLALAWLLKRSPVMLPIPGTSKVAHLEENVAAADIELSDASSRR